MPRSQGPEQQQSYGLRVAGEGRRMGSREKVIEYKFSHLNWGVGVGKGGLLVG